MCFVRFQVEGLGLTLKRNQAYVMKYIMQDYNKLAYVLDQPREFREKILTLKAGKDHLKYLINLIDLLATCAEVCGIMSLSLHSKPKTLTDPLPK